MSGKENKPKLRFAPSPTGHLHIGGARTALYNWLFAKQTGGTFVLRIEDTDRERSTDEYVHSIIEGLEWLRLEWDEGPYHQIERMDLYKSYIEKLMSEGRAYKCFCTPEELDERKKAMLARGEKPKYDGLCRSANQHNDKKFCIRFLTTPKGKTIVHDLIKGDVEFENAELDDLVIQRTDGIPTYNFCVVIDDALMRMTHIIRGDDHLNNTPRQIQLYQALGFEAPQFAHLPMILGADKTRLSKRHGATSVLAYREMGFLPEALINFLVRIGWSHGNQEIFSREELIQKFSLEHVGTSGGVFNQEKLLWLNAHYLKQTDDKALAAMATPFLEAEGFTLVNDENLNRMVHSVKERSRTIVELTQAMKVFLTEAVEIDEKLSQKFLNENSRPLLKELLPLLQSLNPFTEERIKQTVEGFILQNQLKLGDIAQPIRVSLTGTTVSPGIYELMFLLGRDKTIQRIKRVLTS